MIQMQNQLKIQQEYVVQLLHQLTNDYKHLRREQQQIARQYPNSDEEFTILEELELLIDNICGYASQIQATEAVKDSNDAIAHLQKLRVFDQPTLAQFYIQAELQYPNTHRYVQTLDYLRLLILEYLQIQQSRHPISA